MKDDIISENKFEMAYQAHKKQKRIGATVSVLMAAVISISGVLISKRLSKKPEIIDETTTISDVTEANKLLLTEDFDINNKDSVSKRAQEIYSYMNKETNDKNTDLDISVLDVKNLIYYFNGKFENIEFKANMTNAQKFRYLQEMGLRIYDVLFQNITDDVKVMTQEVNKEKITKINDDNEIFAYMFMANGKDNKESDKAKSIKLANIIYNQLEDIKNNKVENFGKNANDFYNYAKQIIENKNIKPENYIMLIDDIKTKYPLFASGLTKDQVSYLMKEWQNNNLNLVGFNAANKLGLRNEIKNDCKTSKETYKYVQSDAKKAESLIKSVIGETVTKAITKGGEKVRTESKIINTPTTKVERETFIPKIEVTTGTYTKVEKGGEVVSEIDYTYVDADEEDIKKYLDEETTALNEESETLILIDKGGKPVK